MTNTNQQPNTPETASKKAQQPEPEMDRTNILSEQIEDIQEKLESLEEDYSELNEKKEENSLSILHRFNDVRIKGLDIDFMVLKSSEKGQNSYGFAVLFNNYKLAPFLIAISLATGLGLHYFNPKVVPPEPDNTQAEQVQPRNSRLSN